MEKKPPILLVHALAAKTGGGTTYLISFANQCRDLKHNIRVVFLLSRHVELPEADHLEKIILPWAGTNWITRIIFDQLLLPIFLWLKPETKLYCFGNFSPAWGPKKNVVLIQNAKYYDPVFLEKELLIKKLIAKLQGKIAWLGARHSMEVHFPTETMRTLVTGRYPGLKQKGKVNHFGVNTELTSRFNLENPKEYTTSNGLEFIYVMNYTLQKNIGYLLKALAIAKKNRLTVTIKLTSDLKNGPPSCRDVDWKIINDNHLLQSGHLELLGPVFGDELFSLYNKCTGAVFPSFCEAFGHPLIETMMMKKPLLCADRPYSRELCGPYAIYFNPAKPEELFNIWKNWDKILGNWSPAPEEYIQERFNWKNHTQRVLEGLEL